MAKEDQIEFSGTVVEALPNTTFKVLLTNGRKVLTTMAGQMRRNRIRVIVGDEVTVAVSLYDFDRGRITFREKKSS